MVQGRMTGERRNFKEELRDFWDENGRVIKIGAKMLLIGLGVGFIKGVLTLSEMHSREINSLIDKIPNCPDPDDLMDILDGLADQGVTKADILTCCDELVKDGHMVEMVVHF